MNRFINRYAMLSYQFFIPVLVISAFASLSAVTDLRLEIPLLILMTAVITVLILIDLYLSENRLTNSLRSPAVIIITASIIRFLFVFQPAVLSDDLFRYFVDGSQLIAKQNPYSDAPGNYAGQHHIDQEILSNVNHPDLVTIYPPAAQIVFGAGAVFRSLSGMKMMFTIIDLATCILIIAFLRRLQLPASRSVLYAWHPLPVLEISSSGHVDGVALFFLLAGFLFIYQHALQGQVKQNGLIPEKRFYHIILSGFLFSCAFLTKLFPLVFLPVVFLLIKNKGKYYFAAGFLTGTILLSVPFFPDIVNAVETLKLYTRTWEFSGFLFRKLRHVTDSGSLSRTILATGFVFLILLRSIQKNTASGPCNKEGLKQALKSCYFISFAYLLLTPTLHPWYGLYMVLFLPFIPFPSGITLSWAVFLSYYIQLPYTILGIWQENNLVPALIFSAPLLAMIFNYITRKIKTVSR